MKLDPNIYFAIYTGLIFCLFISVIYLDKKIAEPDILLRANEEVDENGENTNALQRNITETFSTIW